MTNQPTTRLHATRRQVLKTAACAVTATVLRIDTNVMVANEAAPAQNIYRSDQNHCQSTSAPTSAEEPTPSHAPEAGFVSLFNGKDLSGWHVMNGARFSAKDGVIFLDRGGAWLRSEKQFKDFELRLEFRFLEKGANSGFFVRANADDGPSKAYQVQTMDGDSICDIYTRSLAKPTVERNTERLKQVMKPVGEWQSYTITMKAGHLEVRLNEVLITVAENLADQPGYLGPQGEGGRLEFRNLRIRE